MSAKRSPKPPHTAATTSSPGETRLATADSSPPLPDDVRTRRSPAVSKTRLAPAVTSASSCANSGPRWSIIGWLAALTTRCGTGVGPGIRSCCSKVMVYSWIRPRRSALGVRREWQQGDRAGPLQRGGQRPLVLGAGARDPARQDLAPLGEEPPQPADLLVVDVVDALDTEGADLAAGSPAGPPLPSIGHRGHVLLGKSRSERDVVGVHVADARAGIVRRRRRLVGGRPLACAPCLEELHVVGDDLGRAPLLAILAFPGPRLQPPLDVHEGALLRVLRHQLGQHAPADVPGDDVVVVGELAPLALRAAAVAVGRDAERGDRLPARRVAHLRVSGEASDQHDFVQARAHGWAALPASAGTCSSEVAAAGAGAGASRADAAAPRLARRSGLGSGLRTTRCRNTVSEILSVASISGTRAGSTWKSVSTYWP